MKLSVSTKNIKIIIKKSNMELINKTFFNIYNTISKALFTSTTSVDTLLFATPRPKFRLVQRCDLY